MEYRFLGNSGLKVSALSLGGWVTIGSQIDNERSYECMKVAYDNGINFFDNAEGYAQGQSEVVMGEAIRKYGWDRSSYVISTKIYFGGKGQNDRALSRKHIVEGLKASLKRLQLDYVDLVFAHRPDELTPMEEIVRAFNWCIDQGMAFYWGTSEWSAEQIMDAHRVAEKLGLIGPLMEQPEYHMFQRKRFEVEYAPLYKKFGMGTTTWSPLASGVLTGKYLNGIPEDSRLALKDDPIMKMIRAQVESPEGQLRNEQIRKMTQIAKELDCTMAQLAIAWCLHNKNVSTVITGASKPAQVLENLKALDVYKKLDDSVVARLEAILDNKPKAPIARW
jgi:voltage-dependent potassium channel beta subunit